MEPSRIETYRRRLIAMRRSVEQDFQINQSPSSPRGRDIFFEGDILPADRHPRLTLTELHFEIDRALARISRGGFGQCSACQRPIEEARLSLIPYTSRCHICAIDEISTLDTSAGYQTRKV